MSSRSPQSLPSIVRTAWHLVHGFKKPFWLAAAYAIGILIALTLMTLPLHYFGKFAGIAQPMHFLMAIMISYFTLPAGLGIYLMGLHHANQQPIKASDIFGYYRLTIMGQVFLLTLLFIMSMILLWMVPAWWFRILLLLVLICFATIWIFSTMLVAEQDIAFIPAVMRASKAVSRHVLKIIGLYILMGFLLFAGLLTAGIAYIWILPFIINIFALLYRGFFATAQRSP